MAAQDKPTTVRMTPLQEATPGPHGPSRRAVLRGLAIGGAGLALAGLTTEKVRAAGDTTSISQFVDLALTAEMLSTTFYSNAVANASALGISGDDLTFLKAAQVEEEDHARLFRLLGGTPVTDTFSLPAGPATFADRSAFISTILTIEAASVAAYLTVVPMFADAGRSDLAQLAAKVGAVEGEHRALARRLAGMAPANNVSFEDTPYRSLGELLARVQAFGLFSPSGANSFSYPGPVAIDPSGISNRHP